MARPKGVKNKPKRPLTYDSIELDFLTPEIASRWLSISRKELMRKIHTNEIPVECYIKSGNRTKLIRNRLAIHYGIKTAV